jgi:NodT family efflux transporter outer membrane factor (OMF) lipoprotein
MQQTKLVLYSFFIVVMFLAACKNYKAIQTPAEQKLPSAYTANSTADTALHAVIQWRQYFTDTSLQALIDSALQRNNDLLVAMERIKMAEAYLMKARGSFYPNLNGNASAGVERYGDYTMNGVGNYDTNLSPNISGNQKIPNPTPDYFLGLRSTWEIDVWGKLKNKKKAAVLRLLATTEGQHLLKTSIVAEVAGLYYNLLALDEELNIIKRNIVYQQNAFDIIQVQKEAGRATELAVQQFRAQLYHTRSYEYVINQQVTEAESQLNLLSGRFPQRIKRDTTALLASTPALLNAGVPARLLEQRPDIRQAVAELQASKADVAAARAAALPSINITSYFGVNSFNAGLLFSAPSLVFGLIGGLTAPIFNQKEIRSNYLITGAAQREAFYNYQKAVLTGVSEVYNSLSAIDNNKKVQQLKDSEVNELQQAVSSANDLYLTGYASYLEVITAQRSVLDAELEKNTAQKNYFLALINMYKALGGGWQ